MDGLINMTDTSQGNTGGNIEEGKLTKRSFLARVSSLGKAEGLGDNSRPGLFMIVTEAATNRVIDLTKKSDGTDVVDEIFARYSQEVATAQGVGWKPQASAKQQTSKLRVAVKMGLLPQVKAMEVLNTIVECQREQRAANDGANDYPPYDGMVKVARFQCQYPDKQIDRPTIEGLLIKPPGQELDEADRLEKVMKQITALADKKEDPVSPESVDALQDAASTIMTRIRELGGSTAMRKQAKKAEEAAQQVTALVDLSRERAAKAAAMLAPAPGLIDYLAKRREEAKAAAGE